MIVLPHSSGCQNCGVSVLKMVDKAVTVLYTQILIGWLAQVLCITEISQRNVLRRILMVHGTCASVSISVANSLSDINPGQITNCCKRLRKILVSYCSPVSVALFPPLTVSSSSIWPYMFEIPLPFRNFHVFCH